MEIKSKTAVILINLGTPDSADVKSVRKYLAEFLMDPEVINLPYLMRLCLIYGLVLPFRPYKTAKAYQAVWLPEGSPLKVYSELLAKDLAQNLKGKFSQEDYNVALAMRYGNPSMSVVMQNLAKQLKQDEIYEKIIVMPLYPQYALASTKTAIDSCLKNIYKYLKVKHLYVITDFFAEDFYIKPLARLINQHLPENFEHIIFSYHGLPVSQVQITELNRRVCEDHKACPVISPSNRYCYRAQSYATSRALAAELHLENSDYTVSFQSRFGFNKWIMPYTDQILAKLREQNIKNLVIVCPAFIIDCIETLEEIGIGIKEKWLQLGGSSLTLIPCLNNDPIWITELANKIHATSRMLS